MLRFGGIGQTSRVETNKSSAAIGRVEPPEHRRCGFPLAVASYSPTLRRRILFSGGRHSGCGLAQSARIPSLHLLSNIIIVRVAQ